MDNLDYKIELDKTFDNIGENKLAALATSSQNIPTVRMVSVIVYDKKIYFQTGVDLMKYKQISKNNNVALCFDNIQIEGTANIMGKPGEHAEIMELYKKHYKNSFETYSNLDKEILIEIVIKKITKWEYNHAGKPYRIFINLDTKNVSKEMYLE